MPVTKRRPCAQAVRASVRAAFACLEELVRFTTLDLAVLNWTAAQEVIELDGLRASSTTTQKAHGVARGGGAAAAAP